MRAPIGRAEFTVRGHLTAEPFAQSEGPRECSPANGVKLADVNAGEADGLTSDEREELRRLRREVKVREILRKPPLLVSS